MQSYVSNLDGTRAELVGYWHVYGGSKALVRSPSLLISILLSCVLAPLWWAGNWPDVSIAILPNLLGFSLGAMTIVLAFPNSKLFSLVHEGGRTDSYYIMLASSFVHFILVQIFALIVALLGKAYTGKILSFLGTAALLYALLSTVMTALALFGIAQISNHPNSKSFTDD